MSFVAEAHIASLSVGLGSGSPRDSPTRCHLRFTDSATRGAQHLVQRARNGPQIHRTNSLRALRCNR